MRTEHEVATQDYEQLVHLCKFYILRSNDEGKLPPKFATKSGHINTAHCSF